MNAWLPQTSEQRMTELAHDVVAASYVDHLAGGHPFDPPLFLTKPTILRRLANLLAERVPTDADRIAGRESGASVLAAALSLATGLPLVLVPQAAGSSICGELYAADRVVLVEDVMDTGAHAVQACQSLQARAAHVATVLAVIDLGNDARAAVSEHGVTVEVVFALRDLPLPFAGGRT